MKSFRTISRIIVGLVFIFSGFVKGVDPMGFVFQIQDYFVAFGTPWANNFALFLSISQSALEFVIGISLLFNLWIKGSAWVLLPMMIFYTFLTFFNYIYNLVPECGCFGDAVKMTNFQTFMKNIVLMVFVIPVFMNRKKYRGLFHMNGNTLILLAFTGAFTAMSLYSYRHLPIIDFMNWKVGNRINEKAPATAVKFYVTYKNKKTGEKKEFLTPNYPWNDSVWMSQWAFVGQRADDQNKGQALTLRVEDEGGNDMTRSILDNPDLQFILVAYNLSETNIDAFHRILPFAKKAANEGYSFICITNSFGAEMKKFRMDNGTMFDYYSADDVVLKTMVRSNPGLVLIKNGIVLKKWSYFDFPDYESVKKEFAGK